MSIRAYRLNSINFEQNESFSFSHNADLIDLIEKEYNIFHSLNMDGTGITEIPVLVLKKVLKSKRISRDIKDSIKVDIRWAEDNDEEYISYYCF